MNPPKPGEGCCEPLAACQSEDALKSSHVQYEKAFADLVHDLNSQPAAPSAPPLPTLLTTRAANITEQRQKDND